jgi:hypothetical protein
MKCKEIIALGLPFLFGLPILVVETFMLAKHASPQQASTSESYKPVIPETWEDAEISSLELPLANPIGSPKHVSADYYYKIPVRPVYKTYPVYSPGHEPPGYMDRLKQAEPLVVWDDRGHAPPLQTEADWIRAGEIVFDAPLFFNESEGVTAFADVRNPDWYARIQPPLEKDGTMPFYRYVVRKKGEVELGQLACATCHTRILPNGTVVKGAQGNFPFDHAVAFELRKGKVTADELRNGIIGGWGMPWLDPPPEAVLERMSLEDMLSISDAVPPGVLIRRHSNFTYPPHIPDLIGVKDRRYLDATGLQQQRSIVDLMRYAAINQGANDIASYNGLIPADPPKYRALPNPDKVGGRYSDEQLYALALYIYSLQPPPNPNKFDAFAANGEKIFELEGCTTCHTPPAYTSNKLTPATGFKVPSEHRQKYDILPMSVGTDPNLATRSRRGTGYYKVPSLKGVWYRGMFGHNGWCATLEDWFDERRAHEDYLPTGFKPYNAKTFAVPGHPFGLNLSEDDKKALIAFLKTL